MRSTSLLNRFSSAALTLCFLAVSTASANVIDVNPFPIIAGQQVTISYDPAGRVLDGAPQVYIHHGINDWNPTEPTDPPMTWNASESVWQITLPVSDAAYQFDMVFNDGGSTWDNNGGADWHVFAIGIAGTLWVVDGELDPGTTVVAENNGNQLCAAIKGNTLYVAAPRATSGNDHFIFLADTPGSPVIAPWDKNGTVADWSAYIGNEVDNGWSGWFDADGTADVTAGTWLEATIDLAGEFGSVPTDVHLAFAPYPTNISTTLVHTDQAPASQNSDGNVDANEYVQVNLNSIRLGCVPLDLDTDCDVDGDDNAVFATCLLGPQTPSCSLADFDDDGDVDLADYAELQRLAGSQSYGDAIVAEDLGTNVTRFYPADVSLASLPPSMSMESDPTVVGPSSPPWDVQPIFFESGGRHVAVINVPHGTSLYGTGEIAGPLLRNGFTTEAWNTDAYGYGSGNPSLYQSHPWVLAVRPDGTAFGVLADTTYRCRMDLTVDILFAAEGPEFPVYIFEGDSPQAVITRLTDFIGRIEMPPLWALGYQQSRYSYAPESYAYYIANEFRNRDIPCDVLWFDIDYMNGFRIFTFDPTGFPDPVRLNNDMHNMGYRTVWMINPGAKIESGYHVYDQGSAGDHWVLDSNYNWYAGSVWPGPVHYPDFTRPETRAWWATLYAPYMGMGLDGVWNDMNEPADFSGPNWTMPLSNILRGGGGLPEGTHSQYHNVYGRLMVEASRDGIMAANPAKRPFVLSRANFIGGHRYAAMWTGDNVSTWDHLAWSTTMTLNIGLSAQPFTGPDLGGFVDDGSSDLFARWMGVGVFMPFCRAHSDNVGIDKEPWSFGSSVEATCKTAIERRYRLLPYLYTLFRESTQNGLPVVRPVFFADPTDPSLRNEDVAFMLGADMLVVPNVTENFWAAPTPSLPSGVWRTISLVGEDSASDVNQPDLRVRDGAIIPVGPVMEYTGQLPLDPLTLVISLDAQGTAEGWLYEDDNDGWDFQSGDYRLARYTATQVGNTVTVSVAEIQGSRPTPSRQVNIEIVTDSGVVTGSGTDNSGGVIANVTL